jgi:SAM-dependent methyltransferase
MKEFWNERYKQETYAYGEAPNIFLKEIIETLPKGNILFPAEGEGRNAVYAASLSWNVDAFDISEVGKIKADHLARQHNVNIHYQVGDLENIHYGLESFDAIALIFAHFPANIKSNYHKKLNTLLKKDAYIILEAFSKNHIHYQAKNEKVGGPKDPAQLYSIEEIKTDFSNFEILILEEKVIDLHEGLFHQGESSVIRFVGKKL